MQRSRSACGFFLLCETYRVANGSLFDDFSGGSVPHSQQVMEEPNRYCLFWNRIVRVRGSYILSQSFVSFHLLLRYIHAGLVP